MEKIICPQADRLNEIEVNSTNGVSDGYHTFGELYEHRLTLFIALCRMIKQLYEEVAMENSGRVVDDVWRSKLHSNGSSFDGWFILGIGKEKGEQITYHLPTHKWHQTEFAETLEKAPEFDGHTSADVLIRIKKL